MLGGLFAHRIDVQAELAVREACAHRSFLGLPGTCALEHRCRVLAGHDDDTVIVGDDDVARPYVGSGAAIGTWMFPSVSFTVPCAQIALDQTGKRIFVRSATSRTPASITSPRAPRARKLVTSNSPK